MKQITKKLYSWASIIEENTQAQAEMTSRLYKKESIKIGGYE